ncbi:MAG: response regulator [bacterium]|nr:response regulator [bacterium]
MPSTHADSAPDETKGRVLIIDDDADFADALASLLNRRVYDIAVANSAEAALEIVEHFDAQVGLIDVRLGKENGIRLIRDLRAARPELRCVIMTAYAALDNAIAAIQEGAFDYLRKPLDEAALFTTLERCFEWIRVSREKVAAEAAQRDLEQRFRTLVANVPGVVYRCANDRHWTMQFISDMVEEISGYPASDFVDNRRRTYAEIVHPDDRETAWNIVQEALARKEPFSLEYRITDAAGEVRWVLDRGRGVVGDNEATRYLDGAIFDISERKRAEEERKQLQEQLHAAQKMEAIGQLAGGMAHDFNNFLTVIMGNAQMAQFALAEGGKPQREVDGITAAAQQAAGVSNSLLTFCRKTPPHMVPLNLGRFLQDSIRMFKHMLPAIIEISIGASPSDSLWIDADSVQLNQILMNLVVNARDAMPDGGSLRIAARYEPRDSADAWSSITTRELGVVPLTVEDTGTGMPEEVLTRICDPFFTTKPRGHGTGLGMSVVHGIVETHGGQMQIESEVGRGTRVIIAFPRRSPPGTGAAATDERVASRRIQATVLLADDEPQVRAVMAHALAAAGCQVLQAADGEQALKRYEEAQDRLDVVILDADMPKKRGTEVLEILRAQRPDLPVILISGFADAGAWSEQSQRVTFLRKPFKVAELLETVAAISGE